MAPNSPRPTSRRAAQDEALVPRWFQLTPSEAAHHEERRTRPPAIWLRYVAGVVLRRRRHGFAASPGVDAPGLPSLRSPGGDLRAAPQGRPRAAQRVPAPVLRQNPIRPTPPLAGSVHGQLGLRGRPPRHGGDGVDRPPNWARPTSSRAARGGALVPRWFQLTTIRAANHEERRAATACNLATIRRWSRPAQAAAGIRNQQAAGSNPAPGSIQNQLLPHRRPVRKGRLVPLLVPDRPGAPRPRPLGRPGD